MRVGYVFPRLSLASADQAAKIRYSQFYFHCLLCENKEIKQTKYFFPSELNANFVPFCKSWKHWIKSKILTTSSMRLYNFSSDTQNSKRWIEKWYYHHSNAWIRKVKVREVMWLVQGHASQCCGLNLHPDPLTTFLVLHGSGVWAQLCPTLCDPMNCSLPGSSVLGIFQARILEWVAISFSRRFSWPRDQNFISCTGFFTRWILYHWCLLGSPLCFILFFKCSLALYCFIILLSW